MANTAVPDIGDIATLPQPSHITLLFKNHKSTTALSVAPTQSFSSIKDLLLSALQDCHVDLLGDPLNPSTQTPVPTSAVALELGILVDKKDASKGWTLLDTDATAPSAGKRKAGGDPNTPAGVGLADGSWVAYRVPQAAKDTEDDNPNGEIDVEMDQDQGWDVILPDFGDEDIEELQDAASPS
jgi:hypothetical protein